MEDQVQEPSRLPGAQLGRGNTRLVTAHPLIVEGPSLSTSFFSPQHAPRTNMARGDPRKRRTQPETLSEFPGPEWAGEIRAALPPNLQYPEGPSRHGYPSLHAATPQRCRVHPASTSSPPSFPPMSYPVTWGFLPSPWVSRSPTSVC